MEANHLQTALPLRYSSHRRIVAANGGLACEVFSGSIGIEGADALQELIVRACNSHDDLVDAAKSAEAIFARQKWVDGSTDPEAVALRKLRAALAAAGAA